MGEATFVREIGGPEVLRLEDHDPGEPGPDAVRVRVAAVGVNFIDIYFRTGVYPRPLPFVCGLEGAGVVETAACSARTVRKIDRPRGADPGVLQVGGLPLRQRHQREHRCFYLSN